MLVKDEMENSDFIVNCCRMEVPPFEIFTCVGENNLVNLLENNLMGKSGLAIEIYAAVHDGSKKKKTSRHSNEIADRVLVRESRSSPPSSNFSNPTNRRNAISLCRYFVFRR
jgi:hypothetical protein